MISQVSLPKKPPFDRVDVKLEKLEPVSFVFGPNGSGKTTISRLIYEHAKTGDSHCISWSNGDPMTTYVYNRDFVKRNFSNKESVPGVFTIGEGAIEAKKEIEKLSEEIDKHKNVLEDVRADLSSAEQELAKAKDELRDICWRAKKTIPTSLLKLMKGHGKKETFRDALLPHVENLNAEDRLEDIVEIERRATIVFDDAASLVPVFQKVDFRCFLDAEGAEIFKSAIVGKNDVPVGALIERLEMGDWVERGRQYIEGDVCPFCQQHTLTDALKREFETFFDETYQLGVEQLHSSVSEYESAGQFLVNGLADIAERYSDFVDVPLLKPRIAELESILEANIVILRQKQSEPGRSVTLLSSKKVCEEIDSLLGNGIDAIERYNEIIAHRFEQQEEVIGLLWKHAASAESQAIGDTQAAIESYKKGIEGRKRRIERLEQEVKTRKEAIRKAEAGLTSVRETAEAINTLLFQFGFTSFKIVVSKDGRSYSIQREDGASVEDTLSEGESSFLTFLYFYHLMNGSLNSAGTQDRRVVVIDDPISSMDSNVLFIVSCLVRQLAIETREATGKTKQLIVLTHNITFHREITYIRENEGDAKTAYYSIRKNDGYSTIERCEKNPISSTYELLWDDFFQENCSPLTAQNVGRRIVETFFRFVGLKNVDSAIVKMGSPDREIARSYTAWANAGSHSPFDDETYRNTGESIDVYRGVLKKIFEYSGYLQHYVEMSSRYVRESESLDTD